MLQDAPDSASRSDANASRYSADVRTYTRVSSRNSAVHFYYLPFYGRKSLLHADSRCAEGRRAIAEGVSGKNEPRTAPSYASDDEAGMRHVRTYVRAFDTLVPGTNSVFLVKRERHVLEALHNKARVQRRDLPSNSTAITRRMYIRSFLFFNIRTAVRFHKKYGCI